MKKCHIFPVKKGKELQYFYTKPSRKKPCKGEKERFYKNCNRFLFFFSFSFPINFFCDRDLPPSSFSQTGMLRNERQTTVKVGGREGKLHWGGGGRDRDQKRRRPFLQVHATLTRLANGSRRPTEKETEKEGWMVSAFDKRARSDCV